MSDYTNTFGGAAKDAADDPANATDLDTEFDAIVTAIASKANKTKVEATGDTSAGDNAAMGYTAAEGLILTGQGSTNDVTIKNDADQDVLEIPTGTQNVTVAGNLEVSGTITNATVSTFTSTGIDDNATGEVLQLSDTAVSWGEGTSGEVYTHTIRTVDDGLMILSGGNSSSLGARVDLFGSTHATSPGDMRLASSNQIFMTWDESAGDLTFSTGIGAKTTALTIDSSQNATFAGTVDVSGTDVSISNATNPAFIVTDSTNTAVSKLQSRDTDGQVGTTSAHDFRIIAHNALATTFDSSQNATFEADIVLSESADHTATPSAGTGILWVKSDTPSSLQFTGDTGIDYNLLSQYQGYISGLELSQDIDTDHDIQVGTGQCTDSSSTVKIDLTTVITKKIDASWAEGDDAGGFPTGISIANSTWYHVFVISKTDGTVDAGFDTSLTATNLLADASTYTYYRRIGSVLTNGTSNITAFSQVGDIFYWDAPVTDLNFADANSYSDTLVTLTVPTGLKVFPLAYYHIDDDSPTSNISMGLFAPEITSNAILAHLDNTGGATQNMNANTAGIMATNTSAQLRSYNNAPTDVDLMIVTTGWRDMRGSNG